MSIRIWKNTHYLLKFSIVVYFSWEWTDFRLIRWIWQNQLTMIWDLFIVHIKLSESGWSKTFGFSPCHRVSFFDKFYFLEFIYLDKKNRPNAEFPRDPRCLHFCLSYPWFYIFLQANTDRKLHKQMIYLATITCFTSVIVAVKYRLCQKPFLSRYLWCPREEGHDGTVSSGCCPGSRRGQPG